MQKIPEHFLRDVIIRNNPVFKRSYRYNVARRPTQHLSGFFSYRKNLPVIFFNRYNRRFFEHNPLPFNVNQNRRCSQIDPNISENQHLYLPLPVFNEIFPKVYFYFYILLFIIKSFLSTFFLAFVSFGFIAVKHFSNTLVYLVIIFFRSYN